MNWRIETCELKIMNIKKIHLIILKKLMKFQFSQIFSLIFFFVGLLKQILIVEWNEINNPDIIKI